MAEKKHTKWARGVAGKYKWPTNHKRFTITKSAKLDSATKKKMEKSGQYAPSSDYDVMPQQWYQPGVTPESWLMPKNYKETVRWIKAFANDPYVSRVIRLKAFYPLSRFKLVMDDEHKERKEFFENMVHNREFEVDELLLEMGVAWQKFGEVGGSGLLEQDEKKRWYWKKIVIHDSEIMDVVKSPFDEYTALNLALSEETIAEIQRLQKSAAPEDREKLELIDDSLVSAAVEGKKFITLDTSGASNDQNIPESFYLCNNYSLGERGHPALLSCFKPLMRKDKLNKAQSAMADRHSMPLELWTVGHIGSDPATDIIPDEDALNSIREMLKQATYIPPFSIIYTPLLKYEAVGITGKLLNMADDLAFIENELLIGLGVNKNLLLSEGPSFSNSKTMALHALVMELQTDLNRWERWLKNYIFAPICKANGWYKTVGGQKVLDIPEIEWEKSMDIEGKDKEREMYYKLWKDGAISTKTLFTKFPELDMDKEKSNLEQEIGTVYDNKNRLPKIVTKKGPGEDKKTPGVGEGPGGKKKKKPATPKKPPKPVKPEKGKEKEKEVEEIEEVEEK